MRWASELDLEGPIYCGPDKWNLSWKQWGTETWSLLLICYSLCIAYIPLSLQYLFSKLEQSVKLSLENGGVETKINSYRLLNPNYLAQTSLGSKSDSWPFISLSSFPLHALCFSHSQIQAFPQACPLLLIALHALPSNSVVSSHFLQYIPFIN